MTLEVIGAGFGRIGTRSTKNALEKLGFGGYFRRAAVAADASAAPTRLPAHRRESIDRDVLCDGWKRLCRFLDVAVPDAAYPHVDTTEQFCRYGAGST